MKFAIGIPTLNRIDLLYPSILLYLRDFPDTHIYVLDNGNQDTSKIKYAHVHIMKNEQNVGVGASWNMLCNVIFANHPYALILNDDVYLGKRTADIKELIEKKKYKGAFLRAVPDWCAFIISKSIYEKVGRFDECFMPAYYEDMSYERRMFLQGIPIIKTPSLIPYVYNSSKTLEKMPELQEASKRNKELYVEMWGGEPSKEKFKTPFNK